MCRGGAEPGAGCDGRRSGYRPVLPRGRTLRPLRPARFTLLRIDLSHRRDRLHRPDLWPRLDGAGLLPVHLERPGERSVLRLVGDGRGPPAYHNGAIHPSPSPLLRGVLSHVRWVPPCGSEHCDPGPPRRHPWVLLRRRGRGGDAPDEVRRRLCRIRREDWSIHP